MSLSLSAPRGRGSVSPGGAAFHLQLRHSLSKYSFPVIHETKGVTALCPLGTHGTPVAAELWYVGWRGCPNMLGTPMPRTFRTHRLPNLKHVWLQRLPNGGLGRLSQDPAPGHGGPCPGPSIPGLRQALSSPSSQHMASCQWPLVGRGRRSSISSSRLRPTSPCMSAGSRPRTTVRCSLPTR